MSEEAERGKKPKEYFLFVGDDRYETEMEVVTGAYVKSRIPSLPPGSGLQLDGQGNDPDLPFGDHDKVSLEIGHGHGGPRRFTVVPPANFG
jgi:hypothetical protein